MHLRVVPLMVLQLPMDMELAEVNVVLFLIVFLIGAYLNWDWARISKKYVKSEQHLYHPLIRKYEKESSEIISLYVEPKPLPFFDYVFGAHTSNFFKKILWWLRSLFLLGLIAMNWWIMVLLLLIAREVPTKKSELIAHGIHYKKYDNDFLLDALAYHLAYIAASILFLKLDLFNVVFQQVLGTSKLFNFITPGLLHVVMFLWGIFYLIADAFTIIISIYDHRKWRGFWLEQFERYPSIKEEFQDYYLLVRSHRLYPTDKKYVLGCLINLVLVFVLIFV